MTLLGMPSMPSLSKQPHALRGVGDAAEAEAEVAGEWLGGDERQRRGAG
jgi:hypothetical protein